MGAAVVPQAITTVASKITATDRRVMEMFEIENCRNVTVTQSKLVLWGKGPTLLQIITITPSAKHRKAGTPVQLGINVGVHSG